MGWPVTRVSCTRYVDVQGRGSRDTEWQDRSCTFFLTSKSGIGRSRGTWRATKLTRCLVGCKHIRK